MAEVYVEQSLGSISDEHHNYVLKLNIALIH